MDFVNLPLGLRVQSQIPLNVKEYALSELDLKNLGSANNLAFTYPQGLVVYCIAEKTRWEWREAIGAELGGLLPTNFVYPNGVITFGINYSNKHFNFFPFNVALPPIPTPNFQQVTDVGNITDNHFFRYEDYGEGGGISGVLEVPNAYTHTGVKFVDRNDINNINYYAALGFSGNNYNSEELPVISLKTKGYGTKPDVNLWFKLPVTKNNPSYPNPDTYTLATLDDIISGSGTQNNYVRRLDLDINKDSTLDEIADAILALPEAERTILETDSVWMIVVGYEGDGFNYWQKLILTNVGKGPITGITSDNLLRLWDYRDNIIPSFDDVLEVGLVTDSNFYRDISIGDEASYGMYGVIDFPDPSEFNGISGVGVIGYFDPPFNQAEYSSLAFIVETNSNLAYINYQVRGSSLGTLDEFPNSNLLYQLPVNANPSYPNPDKYTLATVAFSVYTATMSQTSTLDPTVNILQNTLPSGITWIRDNVGIYTGNLPGAFVSGKTWCSMTLPTNVLGYQVYLSRVDDDNIVLAVTDVGGSPVDLSASMASIEIRVYN